MEITIERRLEIAQELLARRRRLRGTLAEADATEAALGILLAIMRDTVVEVCQLRELVAELQRR